MARLRRLAHAVVWVNPHKGRTGYEPLTGGMQAALPSVDHFVSGHSMAAFEELASPRESPGRSSVRDVLEDLVGWWQAGETVGMGTVVATWRSAPRPAGASMLVGPDGTAVGSVSGGCVEGAVYEEAKDVVETGEPTLERYGVTDDDAFAVGPDLRRHPRRLRRVGVARVASRSSARSPSRSSGTSRSPSSPW